MEAHEIFAELLATRAQLARLESPIFFLNRNVHPAFLRDEILDVGAAGIRDEKVASGAPVKCTRSPRM